MFPWAAVLCHLTHLTCHWQKELFKQGKTVRVTAQMYVQVWNGAEEEMLFYSVSQDNIAK